MFGAQGYGNYNYSNYGYANLQKPAEDFYTQSIKIFVNSRVDIQSEIIEALSGQVFETITWEDVLPLVGKVEKFSSMNIQNTLLEIRSQHPDNLMLQAQYFYDKFQNINITEFTSLLAQKGFVALCTKICQKGKSMDFFQTLSFPKILPENSVRSDSSTKARRIATASIQSGLDGYCYKLFQRNSVIQQSVIQAFSGETIKGITWQDWCNHIVQKEKGLEILKQCLLKFEREVKASYPKNVSEQAESFIEKFSMASNSHTWVLVNGLGACGFEELCKEICDAENASHLFAQLKFADTAFQPVVGIEEKPTGIVHEVATRVIVDQLKTIENLKSELEAERKRKAELAQAPAAAPVAAVPAPAARNECVVCLDKPRTYVVIPCGHIAYCEDCAPSVKTCGICRKVAAQVIKTFHA